jgi:hypothetical protein
MVAPPAATPPAATPPAATPPAGTAANVVCPNPAMDFTKVLEGKCVLCHQGTGTQLAAGLDLKSAGAKARLMNIPAKQCRGKVLVKDGPEGVGGHLFDKLGGPVMNCGERMPPIGTGLTPEEIACLKEWIRPGAGR